MKCATTSYRVQLNPPLFGVYERLNWYQGLTHTLHNVKIHEIGVMKTCDIIGSFFHRLSTGYNITAWHASTHSMMCINTGYT